MNNAHPVVDRFLQANVREAAHREATISAGPLMTRAASGIGHFDELLADAAARAPAHQRVTIDDVGIATAALAGDGQTDHRRCDARRRWLAPGELNRLARAGRSSFGAAPPFQHRAKSGDEGKRLIEHDMVLRARHFNDRRSHPHERRYV